MSSPAVTDISAKCFFIIKTFSVVLLLLPDPVLPRSKADGIESKADIVLIKQNLLSCSLGLLPSSYSFWQFIIIRPQQVPQSTRLLDFQIATRTLLKKFDYSTE